MLGFRYVKAPPNAFVLLLRDGKTVREGAGISFLHFAPRSTAVVVPLDSRDLPFMFEEITADFQQVTAQGHLTWRVADPRKLAAELDFAWDGGGHTGAGPEALATRIARTAQAAVRARIQERPLRRALAEADAMATDAFGTLSASPSLARVGVDVVHCALLAVKPSPDTARALEAEAREQLLREADDALYSRRNNAVEQERRIRENELETEVATQAKTRQIEETKVAARIAVEERRRALVALEGENTRTRADAAAYAQEVQLKPWRDMDFRALQVLAAGSTDPGRMMALAFQELAANAGKVGNLNISPELLETLMRPAPKAERR